MILHRFFPLSDDRLAQLVAMLLLIIFGLISFHAPLSVFFSTQFPDNSLLIKSWKEILMLAALPLVIITAYRKKKLKKLWQDHLMKLVIVFALYHLVVLVFTYRDATSLAGLLIDLRFLFFFVLIYAILTCYPKLKQVFVVIGLIAAVIVVVFGFLQVSLLPKNVLESVGYNETTIQPYLTVDKNSDYIRINSTLRGPNPLGIYMMVFLSLLLAFLIKQKSAPQNKWLLVSLAALSLFVLWHSYSRSAFLAIIVSLLLVYAIGMKGGISHRYIGLATAGLLLTGAIVVSANSDIFNQVVLHNNPQEGSSVDSNEQHVDSFTAGLTELVNNPLGQGVGAAGSASLLGDKPFIVESQYLLVASEVGVIGLILFLIIFGYTLLRLFNNKNDWLNLGVFASGVGIAIACLVLPVFADDTVSIIWWGLAAVALASSQKRGKYHAKKTL